MADHTNIATGHKKVIVTSAGLWLLAFIILLFVCGLWLAIFDPFIVFAVIGMVIVGVALLYQPYIGVLAYLVFQYTSIIQMFPSLQPLQSGKFIIISTFVAWIFHTFIKRRSRVVADRITWIMLLWLVTAFISSSFAINPERAFSGTFDLAKWVIIYILMINLVNTQLKWQLAIWLLLLLNFRMSQFQVRMYEVGLASSSDADYFLREGLGVGATAFFGNAGDFGVAMCVVAPLAFYLMKAVKPKVLKAAGLLFFVFFIISIIKSGARGNVLAMFVMAFVFWLRSPKKFFVGITILLLTSAYWINSPETIKNRFASILRYEQDPTAAARLEIWEDGVRIFLENPLTGAGINNFVSTSAAYYRSQSMQSLDLAPHNIFIQVSSEIGILGLICLVLVILMIFRRNMQTRRLLLRDGRKNDWITNFAYALDLSVVGYVVSGSFLSVLYYPHLYLILAFTVSLHHITRQRVKADLDLLDIDRKGPAKSPQPLAPALDTNL